MLSEQEQSDLDTMKSKILEEKIKTVDYILHCKRNGIMHTGYATIESLAIGSISRLEVLIQKLHKEYINKYPD